MQKNITHRKILNAPAACNRCCFFFGITHTCIKTNQKYIERWFINVKTATEFNPLRQRSITEVITYYIVRLTALTRAAVDADDGGGGGGGPLLTGRNKTL